MRASLAMVLRVTSGMIVATASLAPEPTKIVEAARPFDPFGDVAAWPGTPVPLPGCMLEIPPEPVTTNDKGMAVPGKELIRT